MSGICCLWIQSGSLYEAACPIPLVCVEEEQGKSPGVEASNALPRPTRPLHQNLVRFKPQLLVQATQRKPADRCPWALLCQRRAGGEQAWRSRPGRQIPSCSRGGLWSQCQELIWPVAVIKERENVRQSDEETPFWACKIISSRVL